MNTLNQRTAPASRVLILFIILVGLGLMAGCDSAENGNESELSNTSSTDTMTAIEVTTIPATAVPTKAPPTPLPDTPTFTPTPSPTTPPTATPTMTPTPEQVSVIGLSLVAGGFERPTYLTHAGDKRLFVTDQVGRVSIIEDGQVLPDLFLDLRDRVNATAYEQGLLSIAFSPNYALTGEFYVNYTNQGGSTVVSRFHVNPNDPDSADPASEEIIFTQSQPYENHNGGQLQFGPDDYLYIGMGDGGSAGDPLSNGQNTGTLLGALLRINVEGVSSYSVPDDNPFVNDPGRSNEIWAYGLRNPWRFSFDRQTGDLYLSDVGQQNWEEVNFQPAISAGGENYGWNITEGSYCYNANSCDTTGITMPVAEYNHESGCSMTGGYIYRGSQFPALTGNYFFADYCSGIVWSLFRGVDGSWSQQVVLESGRTISSFGEDLDGELYVLDHTNGEIFQLQAVN